MTTPMDCESVDSGNSGSSEVTEGIDAAELLRKYKTKTLKCYDVLRCFRKIVPTSLKLTPSSFNPDSSGRRADAQLHSMVVNLIKPLQDFISDFEHPDIVAYLSSINDAPPVCGRLLKIGEPSYYCRQCATDATCVLCVECFTNSDHRFHKYKMRTSSGGGYCDCGDEEAWTESAFCNVHKAKDESEDCNLSPGLLERAEYIFNTALEYSSALLTSPNLLLPPYLNPDTETTIPKHSPQHYNSSHFCTVLYNDEIHTFDQVINTLMRVMKFSQKDAVEYVTNIDREGRAVVKCGSFKVCCELKSDIEKYTSRHGGRALKVFVVQAHMIAHQTFALRLLGWLQTLLKPSMKLRRLFAEVATRNERTESGVEISRYTYLENIFVHDTFLWKAARLQFHRLFITGMLMDYPNKKEFANAFVKSYRTIMNYFVEDDHEHSFSVAALSVQIFTVRSLAYYLMEEKDIFFRIMCTFMDECNAKKNAFGKLEFERHSPNVKFKRAVYSLSDVKYLLSYVPDLFTDALRTSFLAGFRQVICLLTQMQGMDSVTRQVGQHMEFEPEWESAFNLHIKLAPIIKLILKWCAADKPLYYQAFRILALKLYEEMETLHSVAYENVQVWKYSARVITYDVSFRPVSIHLPLSRLFAGLSVYFEKFDLDATDILGQSCEPEDTFYTWDSLLLIEFVFRTRVMIAQVHAGMWRRNGYSLSNQIYFYNNVKCRGEMLDRDIILLQLGATLVQPHTFLISLLSKFNLVNWANPEFEKPPIRSSEEDSIRQTIQLLEELLLLLITIISERYVPGVGQVTEADCLKREIIQQLCIQPLTHSELEKTLPEDVNFESGMEEVIGEVADFKRPTKGASKGVYVLKPELAQTYNVFFYHYTREELSKSEETQRKYNKTAIGLECCPPPKLPPFTKPFAKVTDLLTCDLMLYIMKTILERCLNFCARSFSEPQVQKILHLIGTALLDEECGYLSQSFTAKASLPIFDIRSLLEKLVNNPRVEAHKDLIKWSLRKFMSVSQKEVENFTIEETEAENEEKESRSRLAAERKAKIMAQLAAAQKNFMKDNAHLFAEPMTVTESGEEITEVVRSTPFVCLGIEQIVDQSAPMSHTCILCQEQQDVTADGRALVYAAFVQHSTVLSKNRVMHTIKTEDVYNMFLSPNIGPGLHTSTCGHVMHRACWRGWYDNIIVKESRRPYRLRQPSSFDVEKQEYLCPLCECLSNTVIPVLPKLSKLHNLRELPLKKASIETWKDVMLSAIRNSKKQNDGGYVYCQDESQKEDTDESEVSKHSSAEKSNTDVKVDNVADNDTVGSNTLTRNPESLDVNHDEEMNSLEHELANAPSPSNQPESSLAIPSTILTSFADKELLEEMANLSKEKTDDEDATSLLSDDINEMMLLYAQSTYNKRYSAVPHEEYPLVPLTAWQSCAYTIHALEQYLRVNDKPLFGDLSSRQTHTLEALVRLSGALGAAWKDSLIINHQASQLLEMVLDNNDELPGILDWDSFGMLVALTCSHTSMYNSGVPVVPSGTKLDLFVFQTMFYSMIVQVLSAMDVLDAVCVKNEGQESKLPSSSNTSCLSKFTQILLGTSVVDVDFIWNHIKVETLPFLRCSALFFCFLTDIPPPEELNTVGGATFENLCSYLGVPSSCNELLDNDVFISFLNTWTSKLKSVWPSLHRKQQMFKNMSATNSLVSLPEDYSDLINTVSLFTCPKSDRADSRYPTMCLVCGEMLCSQTYCCQVEIKKTLVGACNSHAFKCGAGVGMFLRIRDCEILLLCTPNRGCFAAPPYLDEYGEPDPGLNRGNPLKLCPERYKRLQTAWMTHSIYEEIARCIESAKNPLNIQWQHL